METYNAQNPSEMLHLLLDGELEGSMETPLYSSLLENEELRTELRELISIKDSIRNDKEAFTPPVEATKSIFAGLGYTAPIGSAAATTVNPGFWSGITSKLWNPVTTAVIASFVTAIFFWDFGSVEKTETIANSESNPIKASSTMALNSNSSDNKQGMVQQDVQPQIKIVYRDRYIERPSNVLASNDNDFIVNEIIHSNSDKPIITDLSINNAQPNNTEYISDNLTSAKSQSSERYFVNDDNFYKSPEKGTALVLHFKTMSGTSFPYVNLNNGSDKLINNFSLGAFVPLTDNLHLGLEAGQEPFSMVFWDIDDIDNQLYKIEQNPSLLWAGLGFKYNWNQHVEFLANAEPFMHLTLGSTSVGPFLRSTAGLQFISESGLGILLGLEGSSLLYQNDNEFYTSNKYGITYGMFMKF